MRHNELRQDSFYICRFTDIGRARLANRIAYILDVYDLDEKARFDEVCKARAIAVFMAEVERVEVFTAQELDRCLDLVAPYDDIITWEELGTVQTSMTTERMAEVELVLREIDGAYDTIGTRYPIPEIRWDEGGSEYTCELRFNEYIPELIFTKDGQRMGLYELRRCRCRLRHALMSIYRGMV